MYRQKSSIFVKYSADFGPSPLSFLLSVSGLLLGAEEAAFTALARVQQLQSETLECVMLY